jgi:hypothetical protein
LIAAIAVRSIEMHLFDTCVGMGKKLFDEPVSDTSASAFFRDIDRVDAAPVPRSFVCGDIKAGDSDQAPASEGAQHRAAEPMAISSQHGIAAFVLFR